MTSEDDLTPELRAELARPVPVPHGGNVLPPDKLIGGRLSAGERQLLEDLGIDPDAPAPELSDALREIWANNPRSAGA